MVHGFVRSRNKFTRRLRWYTFFRLFNELVTFIERLLAFGKLLDVQTVPSKRINLGGTLITDEHCLLLGLVRCSTHCRILCSLVFARWQLR